MGVNYGLNKVRFTAPVPVGSRLRGRLTLLSAEPIERDGLFAVMRSLAAEGRTILITRVIKVTPEKLWRCWTDPALLPQWFGPEGYSCTTKEISLRQGGIWRFDMIGPDGKVWPNRHRFTLYDQPRRIEFLMDGDTDADTPFEVVVTLTPEAGGTRTHCCA